MLGDIRGLLFRFTQCLGILVLTACLAHGHAPPVYVPIAPFHVKGSLLFDGTDTNFVLRGAQVPDLNQGTALTFRVMQQRWNMNTVRLPISIPAWRRDGADYVKRIREIS